MNAALDASQDERRKLRAILAYDGTDFNGFQVQRSTKRRSTAPSTLRTVQGTLEGALAQILQKPTPLVAAGRTDSGVHAVGQVVAFRTTWDRPLADLHRALNAVLPDDVVLLDLSRVSLGFHPRYDALGRTYCYTIWNRPLRSPLLRRTALWVRQPLDLVAMQEAAALLVGRHDFATFGRAPRPAARVRPLKATEHDRSPSARPATVRHVFRAVWSPVGEPLAAACSPVWQQRALGDAGPYARPGGPRSPQHPVMDGSWLGRVEFTIEANAFLYRMVRSIVGTLLQVGRGDLSISEFASALYGADRALAGPTAAPHGLCLVKVRYPPAACGNGADIECRADAEHRTEKQ